MSVVTAASASASAAEAIRLHLDERDPEQRGLERLGESQASSPDGWHSVLCFYLSPTGDTTRLGEVDEDWFDGLLSDLLEISFYDGAQRGTTRYDKLQAAEARAKSESEARKEAEAKANAAEERLHEPMEAVLVPLLR